jgi:DNA repair exonuclease SbcCD nuclease subunit
MDNIQYFNESTVNKVIFLADIHFGLRANSIEWNNNVKDYFDSFFFPLLKKETIDNNCIIIIAGDYFDNRQSIDINILNTAIDIMKKMMSVCPIYMIIGNHDIYRKSNTDITSLKIFESFEHVHIVKNIAFLTLLNNIKFLLISWQGDIKKETEIIQKYKTECNSIILHTELSGMTYDNGRNIVDGINTDVIGQHNIISGHIHTRQLKKTSDGVKLYLGSPFQSRRSDIDNERGIYIFNILQDKPEISFIPNTYSPKFLKVQYQYILNVKSSKINVEQELSKIFNNNYIDIIITAEQSKMLNPTKLVDDLSIYSPRNIEIVLEKPISVNNIDHNSLNSEITVMDAFNYSIHELGLNTTDISTLVSLNQTYINQIENNL